MGRSPDPSGSVVNELAVGRPRVSVVIPTLSEASNLPHVLPRLPPDVYEVILVDGFSTDETVVVARALLPAVRIIYQDRPGKGNALACGIAASRGDVVVTIDADGSTHPEEIPRFVKALEDGAHFAKGSRFLPGGGSEDITPLRFLGNWVLTRLVNVLFGTNYSDLCYGVNALWRSCAEELAVDVDGFEVEALLSIRAAKAGLDVVEVPSLEARRIHGKSNLKTFRDGWRVLKTICRERSVRRDPSIAEVLAGRVVQAKSEAGAPSVQDGSDS